MFQIGCEFRPRRVLAGAAAVLAMAMLGAAPALAEALGDIARKTHYHGIAFARAGTAKLLLATHHGMYAVDAMGAIERISARQDFMGFSPAPADPLSYYASGHPADGGNSGFLKSTDGGASWTMMSEGVDGPVDFHQMSASPADHAVIYGIYGNVQMSRDGGATWTVMGPAPDEVIAIAASARDANTLYAATQKGLMVSNDSGKSWTTLAFAGEIVSAVETSGGGTVYAFVLGRGLVRGSDGASSDWLIQAGDFGDTIPLHIAIDPKGENHLALTTQTNFVLESTDGGKTWVPFPGQ